MAFTVDLGITYLLFLDQPRATYGKQVAREVWSAELLAVLTTLGAFLLLLISDLNLAESASFRFGCYLCSFIRSFCVSENISGYAARIEIKQSRAFQCC